VRRASFSATPKAEEEEEEGEEEEKRVKQGTTLGQR
jgi:hypothetical protein